MSNSIKLKSETAFIGHSTNYTCITIPPSLTFKEHHLCFFQHWKLGKRIESYLFLVLETEKNLAAIFRNLSQALITRLRQLNVFLSTSTIRTAPIAAKTSPIGHLRSSAPTTATTRSANGKSSITCTACCIILVTGKSSRITSSANCPASRSRRISALSPEPDNS